MGSPEIIVEGADQLARNLTGLARDLDQITTRIGDELAQPIAARARARAPRRSGRLADSIMVTAGPEDALIEAGEGLPYAVVVHYGGYPGSYRGQPFLTDALADAGDVPADYERALLDAINADWVDS
jgi:phage gpG-like protein